MTEHPIPEEKSSTKSLTQKVQDTIHRIHQKIGVYGWIALALFLILLCTRCDHDRGWYYGHSRMPHPMYMEQNNNWKRDMNRDFEAMEREVQNVRSRSEQMMHQTLVVPSNTRAFATTAVVSSGDGIQYSVNMKNGQLDGFVSADASTLQKLLPEIQKLGLTVDQKGNQIFFSGDAKAMSELLKLLK